MGNNLIFFKLNTDLWKIYHQILLFVHTQDVIISKYSLDVFFLIFIYDKKKCDKN